MKVLVSVFSFIFFVKIAAVAQVLKTSNDSLNYAIGMITAEDLKRRVKDWDGLNKEMVNNSFADAVNGKPGLIPVEDARKMIRRLEKDIAQKAAAANKAAGEAFLAENAKRKEVKTTATGLQYEILKKGEGTVSPVSTDYVKVHYHGTLIDGKVFDSSVDRGTPADFAVAKVVPGFSEALQMMHVGDKYKIYIPQNLGYGERGTPPNGGNNIKPYSTIIFELELLEILDPSKVPAAKPRPIPGMNPAQGQQIPVEVKPRN